MSRCLVLGAGFSKATGELPLTAEIIPRFREIHQRASENNDERLKSAGDMIFNFLDDVEKRSFDEPYVDGVSGEVRITSGIEHNFEHLLTFIDLYMECRWEGRVQKGQQTASVSGKGIGPRIPLSRSLREAFEIYLYQALTKPQRLDQHRHLMTEFVKHLERGDIVITFNYDLLLETALYHEGRWVPKDGYGIPLEIDAADISRSKLIESELAILKLHGSLHWKYHKAFHFLHPGSGITFSPWYEDWKPVFPGYFANEDPPWKQLGMEHTSSLGTHGICGMLPSYIKHFEPAPLIEIWRKSSEALRCAEEVVVIGYSLPKEDAASVLLFAGARIDREKKLVIVNPDLDMRDHFASVTGHQKPLQYEHLEVYLAETTNASSGSVQP